MALKATLHIKTAFKNERTVLEKSFCSSPFKIADVTEDKKQSGLQLMIMSSSPGVLDEDEYKIEIDIAAHCSLELTTQAYQRLYQMKKGARQELLVCMRENSSLVYIPHPLVPHENSIFFSKSKISMGESCSLIWGEITSCGRNLNGEVFKFSSYHSITEVLLNDKLAVKENVLMKPAEIDLLSIGQLEGYTHQASLICIGSVNIEDVTNVLIDLLSTENDVEFGISTLVVNGLVVRLLGRKSEQLFDLLKRISITLSQEKSEQNTHVA